MNESEYRQVCTVKEEMTKDLYDEWREHRQGCTVRAGNDTGSCTMSSGKHRQVYTARAGRGMRQGSGLQWACREADGFSSLLAVAQESESPWCVNEVFACERTELAGQSDHRCRSMA